MCVILSIILYRVQAVTGLNTVAQLAGRVAGGSEGLADVARARHQGNKEKCRRIPHFDVGVSDQIHLHPLRQGAEQPGLGVPGQRKPDMKLLTKYGQGLTCSW